MPVDEKLELETRTTEGMIVTPVMSEVGFQTMASEESKPINLLNVPKLSPIKLKRQQLRLNLR